MRNIKSIFGVILFCVFTSQMSLGEDHDVNEARNTQLTHNEVEVPEPLLMKLETLETVARSGGTKLNMNCVLVPDNHKPAQPIVFFLKKEKKREGEYQVLFNVSLPEGADKVAESSSLFVAEDGHALGILEAKMEGQDYQWKYRPYGTETAVEGLYIDVFEGKNKKFGYHCKRDVRPLAPHLPLPAPPSSIPTPSDLSKEIKRFEGSLEELRRGLSELKREMDMHKRNKP